MAPRSSAAQAEVGHGLALIAVDGKPAKAFAVGARLDSDLVLQSVGLRTASIGPAQGARSVLLELPALPAPIFCQEQPVRRVGGLVGAGVGQGVEELAKASSSAGGTCMPTRMRP